MDEQVQKVAQQKEEAKRRHQEATIALEAATQLAHANAEAAAQATKKAQAVIPSAHMAEYYVSLQNFLDS